MIAYHLVQEAYLNLLRTAEVCFLPTKQCVVVRNSTWSYKMHDLLTRLTWSTSSWYECLGPTFGKIETMPWTESTMIHLFSCTTVYPKFLLQTEHYVDLCSNYTPLALSVLISGLLWEPPDHPQPKTAIEVVPLSHRSSASRSSSSIIVFSCKF